MLGRLAERHPLRGAGRGRGSRRIAADGVRARVAVACAQHALRIMDAVAYAQPGQDARATLRLAAVRLIDGLAAEDPGPTAEVFFDRARQINAGAGAEGELLTVLAHWLYRNPQTAQVLEDQPRQQIAVALAWSADGAEVPASLREWAAGALVDLG